MVVPVHNRTDDLDRCLDALGPELPVVVVDDASDDPAAVAGVCRAPRRPAGPPGRQRRPGAARNEALALGRHGVGGLRGQRLPGHRRDGWKGCSGCSTTRWSAAVAPRVRPDPEPAERHGSGPVRRRPLRPGHGPRTERGRPGRGGPLRARPPPWWFGGRPWSGFDADLRVGEDVDLVWRLVDQGWRVRYEPSATVLPPGARLVAGVVGPPVPLRNLGRSAVEAAPRPAPRSSSDPGPRSPRWPCCAGVGGPRPWWWRPRPP